MHREAILKKLAESGGVPDMKVEALRPVEVEEVPAGVLLGRDFQPGAAETILDVIVLGDANPATVILNHVRKQGVLPALIARDVPLVGNGEKQAASSAKRAPELLHQENRIRNVFDQVARDDKIQAAVLKRRKPADNVAQNVSLRDLIRYGCKFSEQPEQVGPTIPVDEEPRDDASVMLNGERIIKRTDLDTLSPKKEDQLTAIAPLGPSDHIAGTGTGARWCPHSSEHVTPRTHNCEFDHAIEPSAQARESHSKDHSAIMPVPASASA